MFIQLCIAISLALVGFSVAAFARYLRKNNVKP